MGEWTRKSNSGSTNQSLLPKADLAQRDEAAAAGWACSNQIALSSGQGNNVPCSPSPLYFVPCRISLSSHVPCPMSRVRCPYPVSFWPIADCLTVTCLLAFNFICDALPPTSPKPISLLVFKEAANWTPPQLQQPQQAACIVPLLLVLLFPFPLFF